MKRYKTVGGRLRIQVALYALVVFFTTKNLRADDSLSYEITHILNIDLSMSTWESLRTQKPRGGFCNFEYLGDRYDWFHAESIKVDGHEFTDVGIKKRSFCGSANESRPAMVINLTKWNKDQRPKVQNSLGNDTITLSNAVQDPTLIRQCLGYELFAQAGVKSPRCNFAYVRVNGNYVGLYVHVEPVKKSFIEKHFGEAKGNLYEVAFEGFETIFLERVRSKKVGFTKDTTLRDFLALSEAIVSDNTEKLERIAELVDLDQFINYWSMEYILLHWDGFSSASNNTFLYFGGDGKLRVIPWGLDQIFIYREPFEKNGVYIINNLAKKLYENAYYRTLFHRAVQKNLDTVGDWNKIHQRIDFLVSLVRPYLEYQTQNSKWHIDDLKATVKERRDRIKKFVPLN